MGGAILMIAEEAKQLARLLPFSVAEAIAGRLEAGEGLDRRTLLSQVAQSLPSPHYRALVVGFFDKWRSDASEIRPQAVGTALLTAAPRRAELPGAPVR